MGALPDKNMLFFRPKETVSSESHRHYYYFFLTRLPKETCSGAPEVNIVIN